MVCAEEDACRIRSIQCQEQAERVNGSARYGSKPVAATATATFTYDDGWDRVPGRFSPEPALTVGGGVFMLDKGPSSIGDSAPDTWGRRLMRRRTANVDDHPPIR